MHVEAFPDTVDLHFHSVIPASCHAIRFTDHPETDIPGAGILPATVADRFQRNPCCILHRAIKLAFYFLGHSRRRQKANEQQKRIASRRASAARTGIATLAEQSAIPATRNIFAIVPRNDRARARTRARTRRQSTIYPWLATCCESSTPKSPLIITA